MTQNNDLLQQLSSLSSDAKRSLLSRLMQTQAEQVERWEAVSYNQQALWFHANIAPESYAYNLLYSVRIFEGVDSSALQDACQRLVQRYPILTATFALQDEKLALHIVPRQAIPIEEIDATSWSNETLQQEITTRSNQTIDLAQGPLFRILLLSRDANETILACIAHHIIIDFWAFTIITDELFTLYRAAKTHTIVTLPPVVAQHNDYIQWQQKMLASSIGQQHWSFWQETLAAPLPVLNLPTDHPRPPVQTYHGSTFYLTLSQTLTDQLRRLANQEKVTPFTLLLAGYQTLIFRYTNQDDILIGTPALGRDEAMLERLIDDVTNPIIIRAHLTPELSFLQLLRQTQLKILQALEHQDYPFPLLVERLQPGRDLSYSPLYQTAFTWDKPHRRVDATQSGIEPFLYGQQGTLFDLMLTVFEFDDKLLISFRYNTDLFEPATIERMANHFLVLLESLVAQVDQPLQRIPLLTLQEQQKILVEWNNTYTPSSHAQCFHQLIAEQALATPDALALVCSESALTYRDLNERANQVAQRFRREGIGPDIAVGVCLERSLELMIVLLGILKAGGTYIPLDPHYPVERLVWMLNDAQPAFVITRRQVRTRIATANQRIVCIEDIWPELTLEITSNPTERSEPQQIAYIIYTSGSTGRPKGVMISHHNVLNFFVGMDATLHQRERQIQETWLAVTSISFDISVLELFWTLSRGFQVVVQAESEEFSVTQQLVKSGATYLQCTPSLMNMLLHLPETAAALRHVQHILLGGEVLSLTLIKKLQELTPATLYNMYGPTETTIWSSSATLPAHSSRVDLGQPIANTQMYILDHELQPTPIGVAGELYISGHGVARGYLKRPELTAERFLPDPWSRERSARMYRSGDLARYRGDGSIEYLGRIDHQIKLRGFRIELGEIETALREHEEIKEAVVLLHDDNEVGATLVAYILPLTTLTVSPEQLRAYLGRSLPAYMVPGVIIELATLPLTPNGKIDRQALPHPDRQQRMVGTAFIPPQTQLQEQLAEIWYQLLKLSQISIYDNFFDLGGHSLLITRLATRIRNTFEVNIPLRDLFEAPTIERMAFLIEQRQLELFEQGSDESLKQMLSSLEDLSEDDIHLLLEPGE